MQVITHFLLEARTIRAATCNMRCSYLYSYSLIARITALIIRLIVLLIILTASLSVYIVALLAAVSAEDFRNGSSAGVEQTALTLATTLFQQERTGLDGRTIAGIVIASVVVIFLLICVICVMTYAIVRNQRRKK